PLALMLAGTKGLIAPRSAARRARSGAPCPSGCRARLALLNCHFWPTVQSFAALTGPELVNILAVISYWTPGFARLLSMGLLCSALASGNAAEADLAKLPPAATRPVDFAKDIQPIFAKSC